MRPLTLAELQDKLGRLDPDVLLELLGITSEELVVHFSYRIEDHLELLEKRIDDFE